MSSAAPPNPSMGARISKKGKENTKSKYVSIRFSFFLAKQVHLCLAYVLSKFCAKGEE